MKHSLEHGIPLPRGMMIVSARNNFDGTSGFELVNREIAFYGFGAVARAVHKLAQGGFGVFVGRNFCDFGGFIWASGGGMELISFFLEGLSDN